MKQAFEKYKGSFIWLYREVEVLPKCKRVKRLDYVIEYQKVRRKIFFGLIPITYWVNKEWIVWCDKPTVEYYDCDCKEQL